MITELTFNENEKKNSQIFKRVFTYIKRPSAVNTKAANSPLLFKSLTSFLIRILHAVHYTSFYRAILKTETLSFPQGGIVNST